MATMMGTSSNSNHALQLKSNTPCDTRGSTASEAPLVAEFLKAAVSTVYFMSYT